MDAEARYKEILQKLGITSMGKRPRTVLMHVLEHGFVTTETLTKQYGYEHPPRAIRDVKELGIPLKRTSVKNTAGKTIAKYELATREDIVRLGGRLPFQKGFKKKVSESEQCFLCTARLAMRYLQIDHKVPFSISGDMEDMDPANFMLLCSSCNRSKSWSCEHCPNLKGSKDADVCKSCYWASPEDYKHISMIDVRRLDIIWQGEEVSDFDAATRAAKNVGLSLTDYIKDALRR